MAGRNFNPQLIALLFCARADFTENVAMWSLSGVFVTINADEFPYEAPNLNVYLALGSDRNDPAEFAVTLTAPDGRVVRDGVMRVDDWGETGTGEIVFDFSATILPTPGVYAVRVVSSGVQIASRKLFVRTKRF